ncbi:hypothetical protein FDE98_16635 [Clostridium sporogenes]|uniref:Helix-turn-helix domain-containing protein n=1 Tax=Clostridium sporogenes TaxID=1509 RepID=A0A7X5SZC7_CLOSG|nr:hypothetical protein [Clostridium sporogenes]AJD31692.1 helix-turn-helix family protein [Clostridium botulinum Prevot_594]MBY7016314.1 hypothetical protein [Clostridium sporogenes]NFQ18460.1 hypothetical protein [Clostridium sporogenes]NFQ21987.1 hypothetical protein [Clostridium sporogenes]NFQ28674.1 hypothetical protein [Clostridium sporogenes]
MQNKEIIEKIKKLYNKGLTQKQVGEKLNINQSKVSYLMKKYNIKPRNSVWSQEEEEYLQRRYGKTTLKRIAKKLGRSENAIEIKASRLGLSSALEATGELTAAEIAKVFKIDAHVVVDKWIKNKALKAQYKAVRCKRKFWRIKTEDFWKWAKDNKEIINFSKLERNILGKEPSWVDLERKKDFKEKPKRQHQFWNELEDRRLKNMWKSNLSLKEIAERLNRSCSSIRHRSKRLGLVPTRKVNIPWKKEEIETLINMKEKGALDREIAWELGRSTGNISWKRKELIKQGKLNWQYRREA